jgi:hypothetical protein
MHGLVCVSGTVSGSTLSRWFLPRRRRPPAHPRWVCSPSSTVEGLTCAPIDPLRSIGALVTRAGPASMEVASYEGTAFFVRDNRTAITAGHVVPRNGLDSLAMLMTLDDKFVTIPVRQAYCSRLYDVAVLEAEPFDGIVGLTLVSERRQSTKLSQRSNLQRPATSSITREIVRSRSTGPSGWVTRSVGTRANIPRRHPRGAWTSHIPHCEEQVVHLSWTA